MYVTAEYHQVKELTCGSCRWLEKINKHKPTSF